MHQPAERLLVGGLIALAACSIAPAQTSPEQRTGKPAEQTYKNVQVLKTIPADQLIPAMQFITASLGVECSFCHVEGHFDADDKKPKQTARKMIQMMAAINQGNFEGRREVTCNTCHRGQARPAAIPEISEKMLPVPFTRVDEKPPAASTPGADQLIGGYIKAVGGASALMKLSTRVVTGTADFAGRQLPVVIYEKAPTQRTMVIQLPAGDSVTGFDGQRGWFETPGRPVREMSNSEIEGARIDADLQFPLRLKEMFPDLRSGPPETIGGRDTYQLTSGDTGAPRLRLYFDRQTGLLRRLIRYSDSPLGLIPVRQDYEDYRVVNGVQVPFRQTTSRPSGQFTIQATRVEQGLAIDDAKFAKPTPERTAETPAQQKQ